MDCYESLCRNRQAYAQHLNLSINRAPHKLSDGLMVSLSFPNFQESVQTPYFP